MSLSCSVIFCVTVHVYTEIFGVFLLNLPYGKCPKILNTKVSDKMTYANSVDPDQTAPEGSSLIRVYTVCHSTKYSMKQLHKKQNLGQNNIK